MKYDVVVPLHVRNELEAATDWYRSRSLSEEVANRWLLGFQEAIASLASAPDRCSLAHESRLFSFEIRELMYGSGRRKTHRALFRIKSHEVEIIAIRHVAQRDLTPDDL